MRIRPDSLSSARGYARFAGFTRATLRNLAGVAAQTEADARRLTDLGAIEVHVCGNIKFDRAPRPQDLELGSRLRASFGARPVFLAASTRECEEQLVLAAVAVAAADLVAGLQFLTVIVPRHPQRFDEVARLLEQRGIGFERRSDHRPVSADTSVLLGDSMGELYAFYAACDVAFVGGSLVPLGGQNLLEACAVGKPVLVGPHTFNFVEATQLAVNAAAAHQVRDEKELGQTLAQLFMQPDKRRRMSQAGLALMRQHQGAARRIVALLKV